MAFWLLPLFAFRFLASPLSYLFYVAERQSADLVWQLALLTLVALSFILPAQHEQAIMAYSLTYSCMYALYLVLSFRLSRGLSR
jgi:Ca2+/Na+ antiporter